MDLIEAAQKGVLERVKELIKCGADPNKVDHSGNSPLHWASDFGRSEIVKELIHLEIVNELIKCGADVNKASSQGYTPLHWASFHGHLEMANELIKCGADVNKESSQGHTPLNVASWHEHLEMEKKLQNPKVEYLWRRWIIRKARSERYMRMEMPKIIYWYVRKEVKAIIV